ncbi:hypothetical protein Cob_v006079 [Colletotrichum orbiculare MAFF 240422]|uniref:Uncharacterized protein n=1 Tax=Colletotrichum orbiculare (strain 104-T / ATCC 96160 / CBS 514.97 / LARS 414 / MAFF 240422) TaxID=1213857 RepID=A0A484FUZ5_COLOR|nr:hypothetical protein Cob_v006079 [Colletotrichum orbiculare MAFF 240422]
MGRPRDVPYKYLYPQSTQCNPVTLPYLPKAGSLSTWLPAHFASDTTAGLRAPLRILQWEVDRLEDGLPQEHGTHSKYLVSRIGVAAAAGAEARGSALQTWKTEKIENLLIPTSVSRMVCTAGAVPAVPAVPRQSSTAITTFCCTQEPLEVHTSV